MCGSARRVQEPFRISRSQLPIKISGHPDSSQVLVDTDKNSSQLGIEPAPHPVVRVQSSYLSPRGLDVVDMSLIIYHCDYKG